MGEIGIPVKNAVDTVITTAGVFTRVNLAAFVLGADVMEFDMPAAGRLRYIGAVPRLFHCGCTLSVLSAGANDLVIAALFKNGAVNANNEFTTAGLLNGQIEERLRAIGDESSTAIHVFTPMVTNDYIELGIQNATDGDDLRITFSNIFAVGMS